MRALHDAMTGLPSRDLFDDRLAHAIALAERHNWTLAVMFLDLDHFKSINDTHGHAAGDLILKGVAKRLSQRARDEDTVCRNGGDEFLYLLMNPQGSENIERIAQAVLNDIAQPLDIGHLQLIVKSSVGIALYPDNGSTGEQLVSHADTAMYHAKKRKSGCAHRRIVSRPELTPVLTNDWVRSARSGMSYVKTSYSMDNAVMSGSQSASNGEGSDRHQFMDRSRFYPTVAS